MKHHNGKEIAIITTVIVTLGLLEQMNKPERNNADDVLNALKNLYREHYKLEELIEQKAYSAMETCMDTVGLGILAIGKEKVLDRLRKSIADTKECKLTWAQIEEIARTALKMQVPATN